MKKIISIFLALVLCAGLCAALDVNVSAAGPTPTPTPTPAYIEDGDYVILSALGNWMCVDIDGSKGACNDGDNVHLWANDGAAYNVFTITKNTGTDSYTIKAKHSGLVLNVEGGSKENGVNITQRPANDTFAQRWAFEPIGNGYYYIRCYDGQYMDVEGMGGGGVPVNDTNICSREFTGAANQQFLLLPASAAGKRVVSTFAELESAMTTGGNIDIFLMNDITFDHSIEIYKPCTVNFYSENNRTCSFNVKDKRGFYIGGESVKLYFNGCVMITGANYCIPDDGHGFWVDGYGCTINGCSFDRLETQDFMNKLTYTHYRDGAAIYITAEGCRIENCRFTNCVAQDVGGAICVYDDDCQITDCDFYNCMSNFGGGAIYVCNGCTEVKIKFCSFGKCFICEDGYKTEGVYVRGRDENETEVIACTPYTTDTSFYRYCKVTSPEDYYRTNDPNSYLHPYYPEEGYYVIRTALNQGYCLDIEGGVTAMDDGASLRLQPTDTAETKIFQLELDEDKDAYIIRAVHSQKVLDVSGWDSAQDADIMQWNDDGADDQRWRFEDDAGNGRVYIHTLQGGWMDVEGCVAGVDANVHSWTYTGAENQMWVLEPTAYVEPVPAEDVSEETPAEEVVEEIPATSSALSEGNIWILCAVGAAVVALGAIVVVKKKKATE